MKLGAEMARLADEIISLRNERHEKTQTRRAQVEEMLAGFDRDLAAMANKSKAERDAFTSGLKNKVATMLDDFDRQHNEMATQSKKERQESNQALKDNVGNMLNNYAENVAEARRHWKSINDKVVATNLSPKEESLSLEFRRD
jgi:recombinational DNA repair ATPase RecF